MNDNLNFLDYNYHEEAYNYIKEFSPVCNNLAQEYYSTGNAMSSTLSVNPAHNLNVLNNLSSLNALQGSTTSLTSSSSSLSSEASSPGSLSSSSSSNVTLFDLNKLKTEISNNVVKLKAEQDTKASNSNCQSKHSPDHTNTRSSCDLSSDEKEGLQISPFLSSISENYCDITEYLTLPQNQAAKKLQMRPSTFSKRWKEASRNRKWPWRNVRKIDKEITCILHNMPKNGSIPDEVESHLSLLLKQRQEELKPVVIRIS